MTSDLAYALKLLALPRPVGLDPKTGKEVMAGLGRFGPYVQRGKTFANLRSEEELFGIGLADAVARIELKESGGKAVLKDLGAHPESGRRVQVLSGRYGAYVSDSDVNAAIPKTWNPEEVGMDEAVDLLKERAAKGGRRGRRGGGVGRGKARKTGEKKSAATKQRAARKKAVKRVAAKKKKEG